MHVGGGIGVRRLHVMSGVLVSLELLSCCIAAFRDHLFGMGEERCGDELVQLSRWSNGVDCMAKEGVGCKSGELGCGKDDIDAPTAEPPPCT